MDQHNANAIPMCGKRVVDPVVSAGKPPGSVIAYAEHDKIRAACGKQVIIDEPVRKALVCGEVV